jgi:hypothetical protein
MIILVLNKIQCKQEILFNLLVPTSGKENNVIRQKKKNNYVLYLNGSHSTLIIHVWNEVRLICTSSDLWRRNSSSSDTFLTISSHHAPVHHISSKIRFLHTCSCLTFLTHTAEADIHTHQSICALHYLCICHVTFFVYSAICIRRNTVGNPQMILIRFKDPSEEFRVTNAWNQNRIRIFW